MEDEQMVIKEVSTPLFQSKVWLKLLGVLSIIYGVLTAITIVGIIVCWLPIWMGVLLFQSAKNIEQAQQNGTKDTFVVSQQKLKTFFTIAGILALIGIVAGLLVFLFGGVAALMGLGGGGMQGFEM
jgi:1,4-dihydroxy-2-naphthoate octaprenyltransferase